MGYGMTCATTLRQRWRKVAQTTPQTCAPPPPPPTGAVGGGGASLHDAVVVMPNNVQQATKETRQ